MTFSLRSSLGWTYGTSALTLILQFAFVAVLTRLVSPTDYGIIAVAAGVINYLSYFSDLGVTQIAIRDRTLTVGDVWGVALVALIGNTLITIAVWIFSAPLTRFMGLPSETETVVQVLALLAPLGGISSAAAAWLNRDLDFRRLGLLSVAVKLVSQGIVTIPLAFAGFGLWALVAGAFAQPLIGIVLGLKAAPPAWPLRSRLPAIAGAVRLGLRFSAIRALGATRTVLIPLSIGMLVGPTAAGLFDRAALLSLILAEILIGGIGRIMTPVYCRLAAEDPLQLNPTFQTLTLRILCVALPAATGVGIAAMPVVLTILGPSWVDAAAPLQVLAMLAAFRVMSVTVGNLVEATGSLRVFIVQNFMVLAGLVGWLVVLRPSDLLTILHGALAAEGAALIWTILMASKALNSPVRTVLRPFLLAATTTIPVGVGVFGLLSALPNLVTVAHPALSLALAATGGALLWLGTVLFHPITLIRRNMREMLYSVIGAIRPRLPR